jgi:hypothetical protein
MNDKATSLAPPIIPTAEMILVPQPEPQLPAIIPPRSLIQIARDVQRSNAEAIEGLSHYAVKAIATGMYLNEAKATLKHGRFRDFVELDCGLKYSTANMYMKFAKNKDKIDQWVDANLQSSRALSQADLLRICEQMQRKPKAKHATKAKATAPITPPALAPPEPKPRLRSPVSASRTSRTMAQWPGDLSRMCPFIFRLPLLGHVCP